MLYTFIVGYWSPRTSFYSFNSIVIFGGKRIPELMRGLGKGVKSFKDGLNGIEDSLKDDKIDNNSKERL